MSDFDWNNKNSAPIGTPENPEIIEPGGTYTNERDVSGSHDRSSRFGNSSTRKNSGGRIRRAFNILMWMVYISAPAVLFDSIWFWLYDMGNSNGGFFAWFLLILISPPAFLLTVVAMIANSFLFLIFLANLLGRPVTENPAGFIRFIKIR